MEVEFNLEIESEKLRVALERFGETASGFASLHAPKIAKKLGAEADETIWRLALEAMNDHRRYLAAIERAEDLALTIFDQFQNRRELIALFDEARKHWLIAFRVLAERHGLSPRAQAALDNMLALDPLSMSDQEIHDTAQKIALGAQNL